jgi:pimeloyl-ACP methyl ester carboxylesterase
MTTQSRFDLNQSKFIALTNPIRSIAYVDRPAAPDSPPTALPIILLHGFLDNAASFVRLFEVNLKTKKTIQTCQLHGSKSFLIAGTAF